MSRNSFPFRLAGFVVAGAILVPASASEGFFERKELRQAPAHAAVADIDHDGVPDVIHHLIGADGKKGILWIAHDGTEHVVTTLSATGDRFAVADMNGDGYLDIISAIDGPEGGAANLRMAWFQNPLPDINLHAPWKEHDLGTLGDVLKDVFVRDLDGDGHPEVVARSQSYTHLYIGSRTGWTSRRLDHPRKEGLAIADLNLDGRPDLVLNGFWLETPGDLANGEFRFHKIDDRWYTQEGHGWQDNNAAVEVADLNGDGLLDVILSCSEKEGYPVVAYMARSLADLEKGVWRQHVIVERFDWCQTLRAGDIDNDGDIDLVLGAFQRDPNARITNKAPFPIHVLLNKNGLGTEWERIELTNEGLYAAELVDVDNDGDLDVIGPRTYWDGPVLLFENKTSDRARVPTRWTRIVIDDQRTRTGARTAGGGGWFGLAAGDFTGDGRKDLVSGRWVYHNPGGDLTGPWRRIEWPMEIDGLLALDVDGDGRDDVIAAGTERQYWCAPRPGGVEWDIHEIGRLPVASHGFSSQGYFLADLVPGGKPEILLVGRGVHYFEIPDDPTVRPWPSHTIFPDGANGEGVAAADIDGDGWNDIAVALRRPGHQRGMADTVTWWRNPGRFGGAWVRHDIGNTIHQADRIRIADVNGDGRPDVIVSEERSPGHDPDGALFWFENPGKEAPWPRHTIGVQWSMNNLDTADLDGGGHIDIVTGEHKGPHMRVQAWMNDGRGRFTPNEIDRGVESHLGTRLFDLDGDGDLDLATTGWRVFQNLTIWRNDGVVR
jgi:hypothetical protein